MIAAERTERTERAERTERDRVREEICRGCFGAAAYDCRDCTRIKGQGIFQIGKESTF